MRTLTPQEKRTVRLAAAALIFCIGLLALVRGSRFVAGRRAEYLLLVQQATSLRNELKPYAAKTQALTNLMEKFRMEPVKLNRSSVVGEASAAIQKAAASGGIQLGPIRESAARASAKELASMQLDGSGPVPSVMAFLNSCESLGYPVVLDSVQLSQDPTKPNMIKMHLTIVIFDFDQWKGEEKHA